MNERINERSNEMSFEDFCGYVEDHIKDYLPMVYTDAQCRRIEKRIINGGVKRGFCLVQEEKSYAGAIYLNAYYKRFENGEDPKLLCMEIADDYADIDRAGPAKLLSTEFRDFDEAKKQLSLFVVNTFHNRGLLLDRPYKQIDDLSVLYEIEVGQTNEGRILTIPITNRIMDAWDVSVDDLHEAATENQMRGQEFFLTGIEEALFWTVVGEVPNDFLQSGLPQDYEPEMLLLGRKTLSYGACALAHPNLLTRIAELLDDDFYILPSSVHEVLLIPESMTRTNDITAADLGRMVRQVNESLVAKDEFLSDHVYAFHRSDRELKTVKESMERKQARAR